MKKYILSLLFAILLTATSLTTFQITPAFAPISNQVSDVRGKDFRNIGYANGTHVATFGLEEWVSSNTGYVPYILNQNSTHYLIDNKQFPMAISKSNCGVTVYNNDKNISNNPSVLIEKEWWNVGWKPASSGSWTEIDYSATSCTITPITNSSGIFIQTSKTNSDGTLAVIYAKRTDEPFKTFQKWTNGNALRTNHIFKFMEKYDNIHLDSITTQAGKLTNDGSATIQFSQISDSQLLQIEKSGYNLFNLDLTKAYNNFQSLTATKSGGLLDATFDYGRNLSVLPVSSSQSLDPTFGYYAASNSAISSTVTVSTSCNNSPYSTSAFPTLQKTDLADAGIFCRVVSPYWDISAIPDDATITDTSIRYDVTSITNAINCDFNEINNYPPTASTQTLWEDIINIGGGTTFVDNNSGCTTVSNDKTLDLGSSADSDITSQLTSNWWAIGIPYDDMVRDLVDHSVQFTSTTDLGIELQVTFTGGSAPTGYFIDGGTNTGLSTNCAARTTLATLTTPFAAGDNIIIAPVQVVSSDAGTETVDIRLYKSGSILVQNEFLTQTGTADKGNYYTLLYKDTAAGASPTYTVEACLSATAVNAEAKIYAINGFTYTDFVDGTSQALATTDTTITTKTTSIATGNNIVIASISIDNGGTAQDVAAGAIRLKNNAGSEIASNQFAMSFGTAIATDIQNILIIGVDTSAPANSAYTVTGKAPNAANGEAKLLIFQPVSYANTDSGSSGIGTGSTTLATLNTSFSANDVLGFVTSTQVDDTDSTVENIAIADLDLNEAGELSSNQYAQEAFAAATNAGDGFREDLVYQTGVLGASPSFTVKALASGTGLNGETKMIAFVVGNPITQTNCDACNTGTQPNVGCCIFFEMPFFNENYINKLIKLFFNPQFTLIRVYQSLGLW